MTPFKVAIYSMHRHDYILVQPRARKIAPLSWNISHSYWSSRSPKFSSLKYDTLNVNETARASYFDRHWQLLTDTDRHLQTLTDMAHTDIDILWQTDRKLQAFTDTDRHWQKLADISDFDRHWQILRGTDKTWETLTVIDSYWQTLTGIDRHWEILAHTDIDRLWQTERQ